MGPMAMLKMGPWTLPVRQLRLKHLPSAMASTTGAGDAPGSSASDPNDGTDWNDWNDRVEIGIDEDGIDIDRPKEHVRTGGSRS